MSDVELIHRPAIGAGALVAERIRLVPLPAGAVLQVFGPAADTTSLAQAAQRADLSVRANGPGQWYLLGDEPISRAAITELAAGLADNFAVVDQSHGLVRIGIEGDAVEQVLAKGTGVDLASFETGWALIGHVSAHVTRTGADGFELMTLRGFAESLWHDLQTMAAEFTAS